MSTREWPFFVSGRPHTLVLLTKLLPQLFKTQSAVAGRSLKLDGDHLPFTVEDDGMLGADMLFEVEGHSCRLLIRKTMMTESFELQVDGEPVEGDAGSKEDARTGARSFMTVYAFLAAGFFIFMGERGWQYNGISASWVGYLLIAIGVLGLLGFNVWRGGPLDKRTPG